MEIINLQTMPHLGATPDETPGLSDAERLQLIAKLNIRTDRGMFEQADKTKTMRLDTSLDLRGIVSSYTVVVDFEAATLGTYQKQELAGQGCTISNTSVAICSIAYHSAAVGAGYFWLSNDIGGVRSDYTVSIGGALTGRHLVAGVVNVDLTTSSTQFLIYLNGEFRGRKLFSGVPTGAAVVSNFALSDTRNGVYIPQYGAIHSCLLFNRALTAEQIAAIR